MKSVSSQKLLSQTPQKSQLSQLACQQKNPSLRSISPQFATEGLSTNIFLLEDELDKRTNEICKLTYQNKKLQQQVQKLKNRSMMTNRNQSKTAERKYSTAIQTNESWLDKQDLLESNCKSHALINAPQSDSLQNQILKLEEQIECSPIQHPSSIAYKQDKKIDENVLKEELQNTSNENTQKTAQNKESENQRKNIAEQEIQRSSQKENPQINKEIREQNKKYLHNTSNEVIDIPINQQIPNTQKQPFSSKQISNQKPQLDTNRISEREKGQNQEKQDKFYKIQNQSQSLPLQNKQLNKQDRNLKSNQLNQQGNQFIVVQEEINKKEQHQQKKIYETLSQNKLAKVSKYSQGEQAIDSAFSEIDSSGEIDLQQLKYSSNRNQQEKVQNQNKQIQNAQKQGNKIQLKNEQEQPQNKRRKSKENLDCLDNEISKKSKMENKIQEDKLKHLQQEMMDQFQKRYMEMLKELIQKSNQNIQSLQQDQIWEKINQDLKPQQQDILHLQQELKNNATQSQNTKQNKKCQAQMDQQVPISKTNAKVRKQAQAPRNERKNTNEMIHNEEKVIKRHDKHSFVDQQAQPDKLLDNQNQHNRQQSTIISDIMVESQMKNQQKEQKQSKSESEEIKSKQKSQEAKIKQKYEIQKYQNYESGNQQQYVHDQQQYNNKTIHQLNQQSNKKQNQEQSQTYSYKIYDQNTCKQQDFLDKEHCQYSPIQHHTQAYKQNNCYENQIIQNNIHQYPNCLYRCSSQTPTNQISQANSQKKISHNQNKTHNRYMSAQQTLPQQFLDNKNQYMHSPSKTIELNQLRMNSEENLHELVASLQRKNMQTNQQNHSCQPSPVYKSHKAEIRDANQQSQIKYANQTHKENKYYNIVESNLTSHAHQDQANENAQNQQSPSSLDEKIYKLNSTFKQFRQDFQLLKQLCEKRGIDLNENKNMINNLYPQTQNSNPFLSQRNEKQNHFSDLKSQKVNPNKYLNTAQQKNLFEDKQRGRVNFKSYQNLHWY